MNQGAKLKIARLYNYMSKSESRSQTQKCGKSHLVEIHVKKMAEGTVIERYFTERIKEPKSETWQVPSSRDP